MMQHVGEVGELDGRWVEGIEVIDTQHVMVVGKEAFDEV